MRLSELSLIMIAKGIRTFAFGMVSILTPIYISKLGYSPIYVGLAIFIIVAGNVTSNLLLTWYEGLIGRKRFLLTFSMLMFLSGIMLFLARSLWVIFPALFIGNISTTGTEAGPFQSIETGLIPRLTSGLWSGRAYSMYNMIGYGASSIGALASSIPSYFKDSLYVFRVMYLFYALIGLLLFTIYLMLSNVETSRRTIGLKHLRSGSMSDIMKLSILFSVDAFGGGFVSQSIISYWFYITYHVSLKYLGIIFMVVSVITAISILSASFIAERIGNLRTMVFTHLISSIFLIMIPLAGSLTGSLLFLFLRQSTSQMDVPTRQAFMAQIFDDNERVTANAITNTFRSLSSLPGPFIVGLALSTGIISLPYIVAGSTKIAYDITIFMTYRKRAR